jgi:hypothetical protein
LVFFRNKCLCILQTETCESSKCNSNQKIKKCNCLSRDFITMKSCYKYSFYDRGKLSWSLNVYLVLWVTPCISEDEQVCDFDRNQNVSGTTVSSNGAKGKEGNQDLKMIVFVTFWVKLKEIMFNVWFWNSSYSYSDIVH